MRELKETLFKLDNIGSFHLRLLQLEVDIGLLKIQGTDYRVQVVRYRLKSISNKLCESHVGTSSML